MANDTCDCSPDELVPHLAHSISHSLIQEAVADADVAALMDLPEGAARTGIGTALAIALDYPAYAHALWEVLPDEARVGSRQNADSFVAEHPLPAVAS